MRLIYKILAIGLLFTGFKSKIFGQTVRTYTSNSILSNGNIYKIAIAKEGVYKIDVNWLNAAGISTTGVASNNIQLFGVDVRNLQEANNIIPTDDVVEIPIAVNDGGDGVLNGNDFVFFYALGSNFWQKDSVNKVFNYINNIYSDTAYYFLKINGSNGKRIETLTSPFTFNITVNQYNERYAYEKDLVNFLNSGKDWYGEEFSLINGTNTSKNFSLNWQGLQLTQPLNITTSLASRSVGVSSPFNVKLNGGLIQTHNIAATTGGFLDVFAYESTQKSSTLPPSANIQLSFDYSVNAAGSQGWLNWFTAQGIRSLSFQEQTQLLFRDWASVGSGNIANFFIANSSVNTLVWNISNPINPKQIITNFSGGSTQFIQSAAQLQEYVAFNTNNLFFPVFIEKIANQNLHNSSFKDGIIITHSSLLPQAQKLAIFHNQQYGYNDAVLTTQEIYNEFGGGISSPIALRNCIKMYFDKAGTDLSKRPKYVLLFGCGSYDFKNRLTGNINLVPTYQSSNSLNPLQTYTSDDFFAILDDNDDVNNNSNASLLDVAVGRIPAKNIDEATIMADKIISYHQNKSFGNWRNNALFIADDKDLNLHLQDAETMAATTETANNNIVVQKLYLDAFTAQNNSSGTRYPEVNTAIINSLYNGTAFVNYTGHGSSERLAEEAVLTQEEIKKINNSTKLPIFITATCDFAPHDNPIKASLGNSLLLYNNNGAIALFTTTRIVLAYSNKIMNDNFLSIALKKDANGSFNSLGESLVKAKNLTYTNLADIVNNRKFTLLGDPAIKPCFPSKKISLTALNGLTFTGNDTLKPLTKYTISGLVQDAANQTISNFNGTVDATIFGQPVIQTTKANSPQSIATNFSQQINAIFKGKASVTNGSFQFSFITPKDINPTAAKGKISLYASTETTDATGTNSNFFIGGNNTSTITDNEGPTIQIYLNDDRFVNTGLVNENPILIVKLADSSGINSSGSSIGHDITLTIDGNERELVILNNQYTALLNSYTKGEVRYALPVLQAGSHTLTIKAWDIVNNSSSKTIEFSVAKQEQLAIKNVYNYPNPFANKTAFWFEHNQPGQDIDVLINIYSLTGKLVKQIVKKINTTGNRVDDIFWDGKDENSEKLGKGVYFYTIIAKSINGRAQITQKLYLL